jgi:hypothetical protein
VSPTIEELRQALGYLKTMRKCIDRIEEMGFSRLADEMYQELQNLWAIYEEFAVM